MKKYRHLARRHFASGQPARPNRHQKAADGVSYKFHSCGFTLIEVVLALVIAGLLTAIAVPAFTAAIDGARTSAAVADILKIGTDILRFDIKNDRFPIDLAEMDLDDMRDPWGNAYQYLDISTVNGNSAVRKDRNLVPINTDFDLYSMGKDGASVPPLTAQFSRDDIVRANNGAFIGRGEDY